MTVFVAHPNPAPLFFDILAMHSCEALVVLEQLMYNRKSSTHRFLVGNEWVKMPLENAHKGKLLEEISLVNDNKFMVELEQKLQMHYGKLTYFDHYIEEVLALFESVTTNQFSLLEANKRINNELFALLEWPLKTATIRLPTLNGLDNASLDVGMMLKDLLAIDSISIIHPYASKSYQRQSAYAKSLAVDKMDHYEINSGVKKNQNILYLLFKWGGYHFKWSKPLF